MAIWQSEVTWRSTNRTRGRGASGSTLADHAVRGGRTLCGINVTDHVWLPATGRRCVDCQAIPDGHATYRDLIGPTLTYRQLDRWVRCGLIESQAPGSGGQRHWSPRESEVAVLMGRLVAAGLTVDGAHRAARTGGWLAPGVRVVLSSDHGDHPGDDSPDVVHH